MRSAGGGGVFEDVMVFAGPDDGPVFGFEAIEEFSMRLVFRYWFTAVPQESGLKNQR